ncbi:cytochrome c maturation protein CcmE [Calidifontibacillus erzurumensis]|uniref:Cytochrome c maturation protein CcmE n=1 Tax=Calidifontibacillus erzurumensis TaxID=2741433 RepID=A0A8J8KA26_9BACI|nr:cytochrome c maturation protein CcmE [Calidifontibacillus erzurumensis]NSL50227.1 cytochrome c maturation protein CcmE [Calidifontibacillus erzurumensis]
MKKNTKILLGFSAIFIAIMILLLTATPGASSIELTLDQLKQNPLKYKDQYVMIQGDLIEDSIHWKPDNIELQFNISDSNGNELHVIHNGVKPDNFSEGVIVIVEGFVNEDGSFLAEKVQTKCPSKYESENTNHYDIEKHDVIDQ